MLKSLKRDHLFHIFEEDWKNLRRCVRTSLTTSWVTSIAPLQCRTTPTQLPIGCHGPVLLPTPPPFISQHFYQHFSRWNRGSGIGDPPQSRFVKKRDTRGAQLVCRWCTFPFLFFHFDQVKPCSVSPLEIKAACPSREQMVGAKWSTLNIAAVHRKGASGRFPLYSI